MRSTPFPIQIICFDSSSWPRQILLALEVLAPVERLLGSSPRKTPLLEVLLVVKVLDDLPFLAIESDVSLLYGPLLEFGLKLSLDV